LLPGIVGLFSDDASGSGNQFVIGGGNSSMAVGR
jgi:hypothetical protein